MDARGYEEGADRAARLLAKSWMLARRGEDGEAAAAHDGAGDALRAIAHGKRERHKAAADVWHRALEMFDEMLRRGA